MTATAATSRPARPRWALPVVVLAAVVVVVLAVVGIIGLTQNPVGSTDAAGVTTLTGRFEPVDDCGTGCVDGYVEAGGRDVFVQLPRGCSEPARDSAVVIRGRLDTSLGKQAYRAVECSTER